MSTTEDRSGGAGGGVQRPPVVLIPTSPGVQGTVSPIGVR